VQHYCDLMSTDVGKFANIANMVGSNSVVTQGLAGFPGEIRTLK